MRGLLVALGERVETTPADRLTACWPDTSSDLEWRPFPGMHVSLFHPGGRPQGDLAWSADGRAGVLFDGYVLIDGTPPEDVAERLANAAADGGPGAAVDAIAAGSYNLVILERDAERCTVVTDALATIPLFRASNDGVCLLTTNPVALAQSGWVSTTVDQTACAMYAVLGHLVGEHHFLDPIRVCRASTAYSWERSRPELVEESTGTAPFGKRPAPEAADVGRIADRFRASCERHARLGLSMAQLQSGGMDSRLILSAWPSKETPACYSYGDRESTELEVARCISEKAGAPFVFVQPHGDQIAEDLDEIFRASGLIVFPERHAVARRMSQDGCTGVLDGLVGDVYLGGTYYHGDEAAGLPGRLARYMLYYVDQRVEDVGWDRITETLFQQTQKRDRFTNWERLVRDDVATRWRAAVDDIKQAIFEEARRYGTPDSSLAYLWRDYLMVTRGIHQIAQQGVVMRPYLEVCYPFVADHTFLDLVARIPAEQTAHRKLYVRLFRQAFPSYADVPYAASMLPLRAGPFRHKLSSALLARGIEVPGLTGRTSGRPRSATFNCWDAWLRESQMLRSALCDRLTKGPLADPDRVETRLHRIETGSEEGSGELSHLAAISRWCELA